MSKFFEETMQGLLEAVAIDKGEIPITKKENMPAPTFVAADMEKKLIDEVEVASPFLFNVINDVRPVLDLAC